MLNEKHRAEFHASGVSDEMIERAGVRSVEGAEVKRILGWQSRGAPWGTGWAIPFRFNGETDPTYQRVKLDFPRDNGEGGVVKYESPRNAPNRAYYPPGFWDAIADPATPIFLTEGEKKSLSAMQRGFATISLVGVWGFGRKRPRRATGKATGPRFLIEDLNRIHWNGRRVYIIFDSDAAEKAEVKAAENTVAAMLAGRGADVRVVHLPAVVESGKTGLDDFLVHYGEHGPARLRELLEAATRVEATKTSAAAAAPMELADTYISTRVLDADGPRLRHWRDEFYRWTGTHFQPVPRGDFVKGVLAWLDGQVDRAKPRLASDVAECIACRVLIPADRDCPVWLGDPKDGPADPADWLVMQNGILDLAALLAGKPKPLRARTPLWFSTNSLPYAYNPSARCDRWYEFLDQVFDGDEERVDLLGEWFGLCLTTDTRYHALIMLEGPRRSGKGTTLRTLRRVVGEHNCVDPRLTTLGELFGMSALVGKTCAICPDAHLGSGDKALAVLEIIKSITGEDSLEIHRKHLPSIPNARLKVRFTLGVNELPRFGDNANALMSRLLIIPYGNCYEGCEDRDLEAKLAAETAGIFNWAVAGLKRLRAQGGFTRPAASKQVAADFERLTSPIKAFLDDCCEIDSSAEVTRDDLWAAWEAWCKANGHHAGSRERMGTRLRNLVRGLKSMQRRDGGVPRWMYAGIRLIVTPESVECHK